MKSIENPTMNDDRGIFGVKSIENPAMTWRLRDFWSEASRSKIPVYYHRYMEASISVMRYILLNTNLFRKRHIAL